MQIVIDIPRKYYEDFKLQLPVLNEKVPSDVAKYAIATGTLLPECHGRLGDLGKIYVELNDAQIEGTEEYKGLGEAKQIVCNAPTIIEARG